MTTEIYEKNIAAMAQSIDFVRKKQCEQDSILKALQTEVGQMRADLHAIKGMLALALGNGAR